MLNFKKYSYDLLDENLTIVEKRISKLKIENANEKSDYVLLREYISPRINAVLPKEYRLKQEYYLFKNNSEKMTNNNAGREQVSFNQEYFLHFIKKGWGFETIWKTLNSEDFVYQKTKKDNTKMKNMPGFDWRNVFYFILTSVIIFSLFYNTVSSPWSNEFVGDTNISMNADEGINYSNQIGKIKYAGVGLIQEETSEAVNWTQFRQKKELVYEICRINQSTKTFMVVINKSLNNNAEECRGEGVTSPIKYPNLDIALKEYIPNNVILQKNLDPESIKSFEEMVLIQSNLLNYDTPQFLVYKDAKVISASTVKLRVTALTLLSILPTLFAFYMIFKQNIYRSKLEKKRYIAGLIH